MITKSKRQMIPRVVKIPRKEYFWGVSATPGAHKKDESIPLLHLLRDYLKVGDKEREISRILTNGLVHVDGRVVRQKRFAVGFMDLIAIPSIKKNYRIVYDRLGRLIPVEETEDAAKIKPRKLVNKVTIKGGKVMLVFHDGVNKVSDIDISTGDVAIFNLEKKDIENVIRLKEGAKVFLTGGNHVGTISTVKSVEVSKSSRANLVQMEEDFATVEDYVFPIGTLKINFNDIPGGKA
ncbi:MAG: 30S ribosomal protein S4e [Candidatus Thermoplasmatota archaeon]|jgi:small subunit ribosomal protein S4e|nr:30S ribosomal protein S4e [Candidatus Thermoplasmatota archaeon]